jgi:hypothetical protein
MSAVDDIAEKLIEAAHERFGRPPEAGGIYIGIYLLLIGAVRELG